VSPLFDEGIEDVDLNLEADSSDERDHRQRAAAYELAPTSAPWHSGGAGGRT